MRHFINGIPFLLWWDEITLLEVAVGYATGINVLIFQEIWNNNNDDSKTQWSSSSLKN